MTNLERDMIIALEPPPFDYGQYRAIRSGREWRLQRLSENLEGCAFPVWIPLAYVGPDDKCCICGIDPLPVKLLLDFLQLASAPVYPTAEQKRALRELRK
jgi:hypothetical protein